MQAALLPDRGVVKVAGDVARKFLNGLVTTDVDKVSPERAAFAALLTPQGKIIADFIVAEAPAADGGGFFLDCPRALAPTLMQRLNFYKLRAKVIVEDLSEILGVLAVWDGDGATEYGLCYADPRLSALGLRCMLPPRSPAMRRPISARRWSTPPTRRIASRSAFRAAGSISCTATPSARDRHGPARWRRFRQGLLRRPGGGLAHRASRHRAHRVVPVAYDGFAPEAGTPVSAGEKAVGTLGSAAQGRALAMLRLDRTADALAAGQTLESGGVEMRLVKPSWAQFAWPGEAKAAE